MPQPLKLTEEYYHLVNEGGLVFLDASGKYRNVLDTERHRILDSGTTPDGVNLSHNNLFAVQVTYSIGDDYHKEMPKLFLRSEVEYERKIAEVKEAVVKEERLVRLRAMRKVLEKVGTNIDALVEIEIEGISICKRLDEIDPIYETIEIEKHVPTGGLFSYIRTVTDTKTTFKPRVF